MIAITNPCGCEYTSKDYEIEPGRWTRIDRLDMCKKHNDEYFEKLEKENT